MHVVGRIVRPRQLEAGRRVVSRISVPDDLLGIAGIYIRDIRQGCLQVRLERVGRQLWTAPGDLERFRRLDRRPLGGCDDAHEVLLLDVCTNPGIARAAESSSDWKFAFLGLLVPVAPPFTRTTRP